MEANKYLNNLLQMPIVLIIILLGVIAVLWGLFINIFKNSSNGIFFTGVGTVLTVLGLFFIAGYNNTSFYPSTFVLQSSLTIENASSSKYTLTAMSYVSLLVPFVLAYIVYAWYKMDAVKISETELSQDSHSY